MNIYYICNDLSLELSPYTEKPDGYTWKKGIINKGEFGYDKHGDLGFFIPTQDEE